MSYTQAENSKKRLKNHRFYYRFCLVFSVLSNDVFLYQTYLYRRCVDGRVATDFFYQIIKVFHTEVLNQQNRKKEHVQSFQHFQCCFSLFKRYVIGIYLLLVKTVFKIKLSDFSRTRNAPTSSRIHISSDNRPYLFTFQRFSKIQEEKLKKIGQFFQVVAFCDFSKIQGKNLKRIGQFF